MKFILNTVYTIIIVIVTVTHINHIHFQKKIIWYIELPLHGMHRILKNTTKWNYKKQRQRYVQHTTNKHRYKTKIVKITTKIIFMFLFNVLVGLIKNAFLLSPGYCFSVDLEYLLLLYQLSSTLETWLFEFLFLFTNCIISSVSDCCLRALSFIILHWHLYNRNWMQKKN